MKVVGITAAASAIDAEIQKKVHESGNTTLIISNEEMNYIIKIVQALEDSNILLKGFTNTNKNETKEQKDGFLSILLGTLGATLLGNLLSEKGIANAGSERGIVRAGCGDLSQNKKGLLIPSHPLTNFEIQKYYDNESRFNGVDSRDNLPKEIKDGVYITNLAEHADTGARWIALFCKKIKLFVLIALVLNIFLKI